MTHAKTNTIDERQRKGREIALRTELIHEHEKNRWLVPSQSSRGHYHVEYDDDSNFSCNCDDYELHGWAHKCKHIWAVMYTLQWDIGEDEDWAFGHLYPEDDEEEEEPSEKPSYPQNWPAINAAGENEERLFRILLKDLCSDLRTPPPGPNGGRPRVPLSDMVFSSVYAVYCGFPVRRFDTALEDVRKLGFISHVPHYNSIFNFLGEPTTGAILRPMIRLAGLPLKFIETELAPDSTNFSTHRYSRWQDEKTNRNRKQKEWIKAHVICGVKTHVVTAAEVTAPSAHDSPKLPRLLEQTAKNYIIEEVYGDKAYTSVRNLNMIEDLGAVPYIPFKKGATGAASPSYGRLLQYFLEHQEEFMEHYHKRSNAESVFSSIKRKFGNWIRSRSDTAMRNEVLCKILCHNICCVILAHYELGIEMGSWR